MEIVLATLGLVATTVLGVLTFRSRSKLERLQIELEEIQIKKIQLEDFQKRLDAAIPMLEEKARDIYRLSFSEGAFEKTASSDCQHPFVDKFAKFPTVPGKGALGGEFLVAFRKLGTNSTKQKRVRMLMREYLTMCDKAVGADESLYASLPAAADKFDTVASSFRKFND